MKTIAFTVYGIARPKGSTSSFAVTTKEGKTKVVTTQANKNTKVWQREVSAVAQNYVPKDGLLNGAINITLRFYLRRPESVSSAKRPYPTVKPDFDKLTRTVCDSLKGKIYTDDSRICKATILKCYGDPPRVEIEVEEM